MEKRESEQPQLNFEQIREIIDNRIARIEEKGEEAESNGDGVPSQEESVRRDEKRSNEKRSNEKRSNETRRAEERGCSFIIMLRELFRYRGRCKGKSRGKGNKE